MRSALEELGYERKSREATTEGARVRFEGRMGGQEVNVTSTFTADDRLDRVAMVISVDGPVQRDLYQAMRASLDAKYGNQKIEEHGEGPWSSSWLVQAFTSGEWSVSVSERSEGGECAVCVWYDSPRAHGSR